MDILFFSIPVDRKKILLFLFCLCCFLAGNAQTKLTPLFKDNDRVCFVGNSITQSGGFQHFIYLYQITRFPQQKISFYNCGVGGDVSTNMLNRMDEDVFINKPTQLMLMVGMNDVNRPLYSNKPIDASIEQRKKKALDDYLKNAEKIVQRFKAYTPNVTLFKPSIYDQTSTMATENNFGVNDALKICGSYIQLLADKYQTNVVDFWTILNDINTREQQKNPAFTIVGADRIHPGMPGHFIMAYQFLKTRGMPEYVSKITLTNTGDHGQKECINAEIKQVKYANGMVSFECKEGSLPFPVQNDVQPALALVPFIKDLNKEMLQINGLEKGSYQLLIDNLLIGSFTGDEFKMGINLALYKNTPQSQQALQVLDSCLKIRQLQAQARLLKRVEYRELPNAGRGLPLDSTRVLLAQLLKGKYANNRYDFNKKLFDDYLTSKPREQEILKTIEKAQAAIYEINQPKSHIFMIRKQD